MIKLHGLLLSIAAITLTACGSGEHSSPLPLQLELGDAISLKEQKTLTLTPSISNENAGLTFNWRQLSGPTLQLQHTNNKTLTLTSPPLEQDASAVLQLTIRDQSGYVVSDTKQITLTANRSPVIVAAEKSLTEKVAAVLEVQATDPDGKITSVHWQQVSGPAVQIVNNNTTKLDVVVPAVSKATPVVFAITATDDDGEALTVQQEYMIDPVLQYFQLGGALKAAQMTDAVVIGFVGGQPFRGAADENAFYKVTVAIDDDEANDFTMLRDCISQQAWYGVMADDSVFT